MGAHKKDYSNWQLTVLVLLRVTIGWHFLYEGLAKLFTPGWSAAEYLDVSRWIFGGLFQWMAANETILSGVNFLNIWGLILIGLGLMFGLFTRIASFGGMALLLLYYVANPPFVGLDFGPPTEGHYLIVNKNLVELFALFVITLFPTSHLIGIDRLFKRLQSEQPVKEIKSEDKSKPVPAEASDINRRNLLKSFATIPFAGAFLVSLIQKNKWESWEEQNLVDAVTSASVKTFDFASLKDLKGQIPTAKIKDVEISRLIMGGNLLSGWAHSRDLIYVSSLVKAYHHKDKIFASLLTAEKCGINTLLTNPIMCTMINEYWKRNIGKIQFISDCVGLGYTAEGAYDLGYEEGLMKNIKRAIEYGAISCYIQGETTDYYREQGKLDLIAKAIDYIRSQGLIAGLGAHRIESIKACVDFGMDPDFWMKTLHHHNYWSADHNTWHDNMYCFNPDETVSYIKTLKQPVIAFKTLAAGAIHPEDGFRFAFENGADFVCAGMYDFQMVDDVNITLNILNDENLAKVRERPWMV
ncbi:DoxX family protein [candidate division KSB1 bacterium]|nr:DoxX family protein [candidate division KSB1 bacterium]